MNKVLKFIKTKILMFAFAIFLPLTATGISYSLLDFSKANAETNTTSYYGSYTTEKSVTNSNFNSSSSNYSISTSLTGWSGKVTDKKTTAGIINVGTNFSSYMSGTYYLSNNPGKNGSSSDNKILMINSKTKNSGTYDTARQGYESSSITLDANSFYSFQVAFKSDTNYNSYTDYELRGTVTEDNKTISENTFKSKAFSTDGSPVYLAFSYNDTNTTYFIKKVLSTYNSANIASDRIFTSGDFFYEDSNYAGFLDDSNTPVYVATKDIVDNKLVENATIYTCDLTYTPSNSATKKYTVKQNSEYFKSKTSYTSLNDYTYGSIYLSGLKDENDKEVKAEYVKISSNEWQTFYFFVATGDKSQTVSLGLWLGTSEANHESSGVVFFDDCHVYQYSENAFWNSYKTYKDKCFTQEISTSGGISVEKTNCTSLVNLSTDKTLDFSTYNFDFENGEYNNETTPVSQWTKTGNGKARVFNVSTPQFFKSTTGYDFVGSDLSCKVDLDGNVVSISKNQYVLGLWAKENTVKLTSNDIAVNTNTIYKIKANYKVSELSSGNAYMFVSENKNVLSSYNLLEDDYKLAEEKNASVSSSNGSSSFNNKYGEIVFYVKGGALYNSSINISLGLGNGSETATGCVVFDNITIENASSTDFENASNKVELGTFSGSLSVKNGNFNSVEIANDSTSPLKPKEWTIESDDENNVFAGVINTSETEYAKYLELYNKYNNEGVIDSKNPYLWVKNTSTPRNSYGSTTETDNVLMLANMQNACQTISSNAINVAENTTSKISFMYKTSSKISITLTDSYGITLFEGKNISSNGLWKEYSIYLKSSNSTDVTISIEFKTENDIAEYAYFDNFTYNTINEDAFAAKAGNAVSNQDLFGVVDMSDLYFNIPTNNFSNIVADSSTSAFKGTLVTGTKVENYGAIVKSSKFTENEIFKIDEETNAFFFNNQNVGSYSIESKFPIKLTEGYHSITFKVKTNFVKQESELDSEKNYNYGLSVGLTNYQKMSNIRCDESYETYTIYINVTSETTTNLILTFTSDDSDTLGTAVVYDLKISACEEDAYNNANEIISASEYNLNNDKVFIAQATEASEEENTDENETEKEETTSSLSDLDWSLIISGSITGIAILLAVILTLMKNVKIKKIERKRKEEYDRKSSLEITVIKQKAEKQQQKELADLKKSISSFQKELDTLESEHKQKVLALREQDQGKVSKQTDKEFKGFAKKRAVIVEKIDSLNKQLNDIKSPEYLLNLERKIYTKDEMKKRQLEKSSKKATKEKEKKNSKKKQ